MTNREHLSKTPPKETQGRPRALKDSEYYCTACGAWVTVAVVSGRECGHQRGCMHLEGVRA